jgi:hypothetical protein
MAALATALLFSCGASPAPVVAVVQVPAGMPVTCVQVIARAAPAEVQQTGLVPAEAGGEYHVAVYPGGAIGSGAITVAAEGRAGADCSAWIAASDPVATAFGPQPTQVTLPLKDCGGPCMDGGVPDSGIPDGGAPDGGAPDAGGSDGGAPDGGLDCGPGRDAGQACSSGGACSSVGVCVPGFLYPPSNFNPTTITNIAPAITLNCNTSFDSTTLAFGNNWCGQPRPVPVPISQAGGVPAILLATSDFAVAASGSLTLTGSRPVIFAVFGNATLMGSVLTDAGTDLSPACDLARGGVGRDDANNGGAGGGGGAFGTASGGGGRGGGTATGGAAGQPAGSPQLVPLIGGCSGGHGGAGLGAGGIPGAAGGAFQCSASGTLRIATTVGAPGQAGRRGNGGGGSGLPGGGGAGAGSGGGLLFEGQAVQVTNAALLTANGGGGGEGGGTNNSGIDGQPGSITSAAPAQGGNADPPNFPGFGGNGGAGTTAAQNGQPTRVTPGGGGGGGGAVGRIRINAAAGGCTINAGVLSPPPTGNGSPGCP